MADIRLVGAVGIKVRPVTEGFRKETQNQLDHEIGKRGERLDTDVKLEVDADTTKAKVKVTKLSDELKGKEIKLNVAVDYDGVQRAKEQINQTLKSLNNKVISFEMDPESIRQAKKELKKLEENALVDFKFVRDEAGYNSILAKIKKIREQKGLTSTWSFKTDTKSLAEAEKKAKEALKRIEANKTITLSYTENYAGIKSAIADIDKRLNALRVLKLKTKLDESSLVATRAKLLAEMAVAPVTVKFNEDKQGYERILSRIKEIQREKAVKEITFKTDDESLTRTQAEIQAKLKAHMEEIPVKLRAALDAKDVEEAKHQASQLKEHIDHMQASMKIQLAGSELTAARLAFLGRDRVVTYIARVSERSIAVAEGLLKSVGGLNTFGQVGKTLEGIFTKFDTYSLKMTTLAAIAGNFANVLAYAGTAAFRIGEGMVQSLGLLAAAPAILGAATVGYTIFTAAFNNFFDAFNKDPKIAESALAALPPIARKTVDSITGLYKGLANPIQEKFWSKVGTTLSDSIETLYPKLKDSLLDSTEAVGDFVAGFGKSMNKLALSDDFDKMFAGFNGFFKNLSGASEPFFDAWNRFGVQGSQLLPQFGQWITDMSVRFDNWSKSLGAGGITDMIMHGVHSLKNMWEVGGSVVDMFKAITRAAGLAGTGGLAQFNVNMRKAADNMLREPWQSRAATIFEGARKGASLLNDGFKDLVRTFGESSVWLGKVLTQLGDIGGNVLTGFSDMFGSEKYQTGITAELQGVQDLTEDLRPSFKLLGDVIGDMGRVAGAVFSNLGPVINQLMQMTAAAVAKISDNLADVAPKFINTVGGVLRVMEPLVDGLTTALNGLLGIVGAIPDKFIALGVAAAAFFALRGLASKFFDSFKQTSTFQNMESNWVANQIAAGKYVDTMKQVNGVWTSVRVPTEQFSATRAAMDNVTGATGRWRDAVRDLNNGLATGNGMPTMAQQMRNMVTASIPAMQTAMRGLLSFVGGGWGIAFMAAGAIIGSFAQQQADAKANVDALTSSMNKQTGEFDEAGLKRIASAWSDLDKINDWGANAERAAKGMKAANETAAELGLNFAEVTKAIANGGPAYDRLHEQLVGLEDALDLRDDYGGFEEGTRKVNEFERQLNIAEGSLKNLDDNDIQHLRENLEKGRNQAMLAKAVFEGLGEATGTTSVEAQHMAEAMATIGDNSIEAAGKIGAINRALDLLKGGTLSAREAEVQAQQSFQTAISQAAAIKEELAGNGHLIDETTKMLDVTSTSGLKLQQAMKTSADGIKIAAQAAYTEAINSGKPASKASEEALAVISKNQGELDKLAGAAGVSVDLLRNDWESFFGKDWQLTAVFSANAEKFQAAQKAVEEAGGTWNQKVFQALLDANPDPAKWNIDDMKAQALQFATNEYVAQLKAMNPQALESILQATGQADNYKNGNYTAVMKALNSTDPGVQAAWSNLQGVVGGPSGAGWAAALKAYADALSVANAKKAIDDAAAARTATITVRTIGDARTVGEANALGYPIPVKGANGMIYQGNNQFQKGFGGQPMQFFADGGFNGFQFEKPGPAKIYQGSNTWRVFAEKSTGSEAFIPMAASKRGRSTQILAEVANQFGYKLQKAVQFENGGITTGGNSKNTGLAVHIGTYNQNSNDTVDDVGRGIMRRVRSSSLTLEGF